MLPVGVSCAVVFLLAGCAGVERAGCEAAADDLEGKWVGKWTCEKTGHSGYLSCRLKRMEADHYQAQYFATYATVLPYWYSIDMHLEREGQRYLTQWQVDLGWLGGGVYEYEGYIEGEIFFCEYSSKDYEGRFELVRAASCQL